MNTWRGLGAGVVGMHAQGFDVELRQYPEALRANFFTTGIAHSVVLGTGWEPTPWRAVQRAAWATLQDPRASA